VDASKLGEIADLNSSGISNLENGKLPKVKVETIRKIAQAFGVPVSAIVDDAINIEAVKALVAINSVLQKERH